jgi:hypothetical protein
LGFFFFLYSSDNTDDSDEIKESESEDSSSDDLYELIRLFLILVKLGIVIGTCVGAGSIDGTRTVS